ncbi:MAG TPA: cytochrome D1 domain-containing protein [Blastocatellia bacterium]|nr:cytochrome D1 domain-containing protein [Blastocatellia bacterium]
MSHSALSQKIVREGSAIEVSVTSRQDRTAELRAAEDAVVTVKITDTNTNTALTGVKPSVWIDRKTANTAQTCQQKVQAFLQGSLNARPELDLNSYYLLTLNNEPNISVLDPLLGFGSSKLYTLVLLKSRGEDWALTRDGKRLFVSMPLVNEVAVVDTATWKVITNIDAGYRPTRVALQPDERYLWVGNDADEGGGVTVIDTVKLTVAAKLPTGAGHHEIALSPDDRFAFVTNQQSNTVSVLDVQRLRKTKDLNTGRAPVAIAYASQSQALYIPCAGDGKITIIDIARQAVLKHLETDPGSTTIQFAPGGRYGFVAHQRANVVSIFDAATNQRLQTVRVGTRPDQIAFTKNFAYVRAAGSDEMTQIELASITKAEGANVTKFPSGQAPEKSPHQASAMSLFPGPEGNTLLIANPADQAIYYYSEGMAAPMGSLQNYRRAPRAVLVADRSLRESAPGTYSTTIILPPSGRYDIAVLTDTPRIVHCFDLEVKPNPARQQEAPALVQLEPMIKRYQVGVGEALSLRFRLLDPITKQPKENLQDVRVLSFLAPGFNQQRQNAQARGDGVYEIQFKANEAGAYYLFIECPSLNVKLNQLPLTILRAEDAQPRGEDK